ncbi:DEAD/DEAH box helicase [Desulfothermus okinawensis JCM 13304]
MNINEIIERIENSEQISDDDSFKYAQICANELRHNENNGHKLLIYILDNFRKIPEKTKTIWFDLIEMAGFYPYLKKENGNPSTIEGKIRQEFHLSENLEDIYFHEEQKILQYILESDKNLIVSAPTSFGKSLLIEDIVASRKYKNIVIIQPTLALLDETRKKLKKYRKDYKIIVKTTQEPDPNKGNLFLLTAERVIEYPNLPRIDFLILDEFYKLSQKRDDERAYILNNAFYKLMKEYQPKFYLLGPNIDGISKGFAQKYNAIFYKTDCSLVENKIIDVYSQHKNMFDHPQRNKKYIENVLFELLYELGIQKQEQTIIYCSSPKKARDLAWRFSDFLKNIKKLDVIKDENEIPLIEWIEKNVSPEWNLINLLSYGIGINDGALIKHINSSIVDYFNENKLKYLFCTTTLIEGVNTTTKNIVFFDKTKGNRKPIDFFDYSNIKGRAGRFMVHYIGNIYNFNPPPEKKEKLIIDIPFYQQNPIEDEVLIFIEEEDLLDSTKQTEQFKKIEELSKKERELFKRNGVSIWGQKKILEQINRDVEEKEELIIWTKPKYNQLNYVLSLAWDNLLKKGETTWPMTKKRLVKTTFDYSTKKNINYLIKPTYEYFIHLKKKKERFSKYSYYEIYNEAIREVFNMLRHWFQFKVPKWLNIINNIQRYVCLKRGKSPGDYTYYASLLENDFVDEKLSILLEYGVPKSAIDKISKRINLNNIDQEYELITKIKDLIDDNKTLFLKYEIERIERSL